ncbi:MAG: DMT family transporter [Armatimonadetes bacterium]|nr:DMT family transporter [Armatimonadota bacterium]
MEAWARRLPHPALIFMVLAWGLNFSVIKIAYRDVAPAAVGLTRYVLMAPLLVAWCLAAKQSLKYPPGLFWRLNIAGFVGSGAYMVLFLEGMKTAPAAIGAIALATAPIMATGLSVALKQERFTWRLVLGSLIGFFGVALCVLGGEQRPGGELTGALLVVGSAALWALSIVLYRPLLGKVEPLRTLTLSFPGALVALLPYGWAATAATDWTRVTGKGFGALAYLVVVAGVAAFAAYYRALKDVGPARTSLAQYFVPPTAAVFAVFVLHEKIDWHELVGLAVVICGVATAVWKAPAPISEGTCTDPPQPEGSQSFGASRPQEG